MTPSRRSPFPALAVAAALWLLFCGFAILQDSSKLVSSDWTPFAVGGRLIATQPAHLYDPIVGLREQHALTGGDFGQGHGGLLPVVAPPWVSLLAAPFVDLGFETGGRLWTLLQLLGLLAGGLLVAGRHAADRGAMAVAGVPAAIMLLNSQVDGLVVLGLGLAWRLLLVGSEFWAGATLGLTLFKPHLVLGVAAGLIATRRWRILAGWSSAGVVLAAGSTAIEPHLLPDWLATAVGNAGQVGNDLSLPGLAHALGGGELGMVMAVAGALTATLILARGRSGAIAAAIAILGGLLAAPHALGSDLVLVPFALLVAGRDQPRRLLAVSAGSAAVLLLGPLVGTTLGLGVPVIEGLSGSAIMGVFMADMAFPAGLAGMVRAMVGSFRLRAGPGSSDRSRVLTRLDDGRPDVDPARP